MPDSRHSEGKKLPAAVHHGVAWLALSLALAVHVADEALNGFLEVYNPIVSAAREKLPFLPLPVFSFPVWLAGLAAAVLLLLFMSRYAFRGSRWMIPLSYFLGAAMVFNGAGHIAGSLYLGRPMPGVYSSPLLVGCAAFLLYTAERVRRHHHE